MDNISISPFEKGVGIKKSRVERGDSGNRDDYVLAKDLHEV